MGGSALRFDLTGLRFGRLVAISRAPTRVDSMWNCQCDCGCCGVFASGNLRSGRTQSCGCFYIEARTTHGLTYDPSYSTWRQMVDRCHNPKHRRYHDYGGRGISVCSEWRYAPAAFIKYMGPRPSSGHSIDRWPDNDGNYEPGNVRWATRSEQNNNRRGNVLVELDGKTVTFTQAVRMVGAVSVGVAHKRYTRMGWSLKKAIETPVMRWRT